MINSTASAIIEQKYTVLDIQQSMIHYWLRNSLMSDPQYPSNTVSNIYFDTPGFNSYHETIHDSFIRTKFRLRWYGLLQSNPDAEITCYFEVKRKVGITRQKKRSEIILRVQQLTPDPFIDSTIIDLGKRAGKLMSSPPPVLVPVLYIQYNRNRFIDPSTGFRISLDTAIRCIKVNTAYIPSSPPLSLIHAVLEIEGTELHLPDRLKPIMSFLSNRSFSKYAYCCHYIMNPERRLIEI